MTLRYAHDIHLGDVNNGYECDEKNKSYYARIGRFLWTGY
jgi:hypothetical protein